MWALRERANKWQPSVIEVFVFLNIYSLNCRQWNFSLRTSDSICWCSCMQVTDGDRWKWRQEVSWYATNCASHQILGFSDFVFGPAPPSSKILSLFQKSPQPVVENHHLIGFVLSASHWFDCLLIWVPLGCFSALEILRVCLIWVPLGCFSALETLRVCLIWVPLGCFSALVC